MVEFKKPGVPAERSVKHRIKSQKAKLKVKHIIYIGTKVNVTFHEKCIVEYFT